VWQVIPSPVSDVNKSVTMYAQHPNPFPQLKQAGQTHKITTENKRLQFVLDFFWHQDGDVTFFFPPCEYFIIKGQSVNDIF
jgi:hypothetical protein